MKDSKWFSKTIQKPNQPKRKKIKRSELINNAVQTKNEKQREVNQKTSYVPQKNDSIQSYLKRVESKKISKHILQQKIESNRFNSFKTDDKSIDKMTAKELFERQIQLSKTKSTPDDIKKIQQLQNKLKMNPYISKTLDIYTRNKCKDTVKSPSISQPILTPIQSDSSVRIIRNGQDTSKRLQYSNKTITFGIQDCMYQAITRLLLWYRNPELNNFQIPLSHNHMISKTIVWSDWIQIQLNLQNKKEVNQNGTTFTRSSFPSWKCWEKSITEKSGKKLPTVQTMAHWLLNQFQMGVLIIPQEYIQMILSMDELLFVEWPFLFGIKDKHIYPIINKRNSLDWHTKESKLITQYKPNRRCNQNIVENLEGSYSRVLTCTENPNYISIKDKKHIIQENIHCFKEHLETLEFIVLPYWSKKATDTIRRAIFRLLRHPLGQEHPEFWKEFTSYSDTLLSFYEQHLDE